MSNVTGDGGSFSSANTTDEANFNCSTSEKHLKKKRNLPGTPDPTADVIALSPTTLVATNRFVCEVCNKGFQRDQNLQLHRRGHNLPWKLRQRSTSEVKKRVYICPEPTCVHHNPGRALGDLTGIKKHFFRKHGEKKWKCEKCSKKYAVQSDWKAHSKICGTREYKCDCGTIFSRRDSFITHRAFCDALAEENNKANQLGMINPLGGNYQNQNPINMNTQKQSVEVPNFNPNTKESLNFCCQQKRPIPLKTLNMSGSMLSNPSLFSPRGLSSSSSSSSSFGGLYNASQSQISATALLQKAAQMTSNPSFVSLIASQDQLLDMGSYGGLEGTGFTASQLVQQDVPELSSQMFGTSVESQGNVTNDTSIFGNTSVFIGDQGQQRVNAFQGRHYNRGPKDYTNNHQCISGFSGGDVMTVDFLGVGGPQTVNLQEPQASQQNNIGFEEPQRFHVLDPFQQPSTSNKGIWDI